MTSAIAKFYTGRSVFITGGSGFIGKQIVEKLLRSCPEVENIYLLIRQKKGLSVDQRLQQTLASPVFDSLRQRQPSFHRKIIPVVGDVTDDFLGIGDSDHSRMASNVSVIIHSAATLSFQEPLRVAVNINVLGVRRMLTVSKKLPKLDALVHISTGYSQVDKGHHDVAVIEEKIYEPPLMPEKIIAMTREMTDEQLLAMTPELLKAHNRPNTYTLTKAIGEKLFEQERGNVKSCILRPTIVAAAEAEPLPGWIDNYHAANGVYVGLGTGFIRAVYVTHRSPLDIIPVDMTANAVIAAAWHTFTCRKDSKELTVYNLTNECCDAIEDIGARMLKNVHADPYKLLPVKRPWTGLPCHTYSRALFNFWKDIYLPTRFRLMDGVLRLTGRKPRLVEMYGRVEKLQDVLVFFTTNGFRWANGNVKQMFEHMNEVDKKDFNVEIAKIDLERYYFNWWKGIKKYVLKEDEAIASMNKKKDNVKNKNVAS